MMDQIENRSLVSCAVTYTGRGGYDVIKVVDRTVRAPGAGEVRISVHAAAVNPTDILLRDPAPGVESWPVVPGVDAAGIIESVGPDVARLHVGQKAMAVTTPRRLDGGLWRSISLYRRHPLRRYRQMQRYRRPQRCR